MWFDKCAYLRDLTSISVNRNGYATFAGLGVQAIIVLLFQTAGRYFADTMTTRELFQVFVERVFSRAWQPVTTLLLTATALLLTHSRGGPVDGFGILHFSEGLPVIQDTTTHEVQLGQGA